MIWWAKAGDQGARSIVLVLVVVITFEILPYAGAIFDFLMWLRNLFANVAAVFRDFSIVLGFVSEQASIFLEWVLR